MNIGTRPINDPYEISSNTQFHEKLDQLVKSNPQQHLPEILKVLSKGIQYISRQDAQSYLPTIKSKLIQEQVDRNDPVIQKINEISQSLLENQTTIKDLPEDILIHFLQRWDQETQRTFGRTAQDSQKLMQKPELLASILESEDALSCYFNPIPLEKKLAMATQAGKSLKTLTFAYTPVSDDDLKKVFKSCDGLIELDLTSCDYLTNQTIKNLPEQLKVLELVNCPLLTPAGLENLPPNLETLLLDGEFKLTNQVVKKFPQQLKDLVLLNCFLYPKVSLENLTHLKYLCLRQFVGTIDNHLQNLPTNLKELVLFDCNRLTNKGLKNLPHTLERLILSKGLLTEEGLKDLPQNLESLELVGSFSLKNEEMKNLPENLKQLNLTKCILTDESLKNLPKDLETLSLQGCIGLTDEGFKNLPKNLKKLEISEGESKLTEKGITSHLPQNLLISIQINK